jgi:Flp pilus assembly pilin Flp
MKNLFSKFVKEEEGNIIEYVIVLAVIAVIIAAMFPSLRTKIMSWFGTMLQNTDKGLGNGSTTCIKPDGTTGTQGAVTAANPSGCA